MQQRQDEPEVAGDGRLAREQQLDLLLDPEVVAVDLVVEGDDFVGELEVALGERVQRPTQRAQDERSLLLQARLELVELLLERLPHYPNRPVT